LVAPGTASGVVGTLDAVEQFGRGNSGNAGLPAKRAK
jgi:hypothetical protein